MRGLAERLAGRPGSREFERDPRVAVFHSMDTCFYALAQWQRRARLRHAPETVAAAADPAARARVGLALRDVDGPPVLTERESKALLAQYGVAVNREARVDGWPAALESARDRLRWRSSWSRRTCWHKTEAGVVRLDIQDGAGLRQAYDEIMANAAMISPPPRIHGLLVQEMVGAGVDLIVGARMDPEFGPFIVVGHGGVLVEIIKDPAIAPAPVSPAQARAHCLGSLRAPRCSTATGGAEAVDLDALAGLISRISRFIADHQADLSELDINPVICGAGRVVAVDARIIQKQDAGATRETPKETSA